MVELLAVGSNFGKPKCGGDAVMNRLQDSKDAVKTISIRNRVSIRKGSCFMGGVSADSTRLWKNVYFELGLTFETLSPISSIHISLQYIST